VLLWNCTIHRPLFQPFVVCFYNNIKNKQSRATECLNPRNIILKYVSLAENFSKVIIIINVIIL